MTDNSSSKEEIPVSELIEKSSLFPDDKIKAASSNWLVEDLTPAAMIMVDDSLPPGTLSNLKFKEKAGSYSNPNIDFNNLDPDDSEFLATLRTDLASDSQNNTSQPLTGSATSVEPADDISEDPQEMIREYETCGFSIGVAVDKNKRYRRTMEDAHVYFYNFDKKKGSGFFAIYDGHAGKSAADYCQKYLHETFIKFLKEFPDETVPQVLNKTFIDVDNQMSQRKEIFAGTTVIVAFVRYEDRKINDKIVRKRILYTANVGDARAVLRRNGQAMRLSYDHKGSDPSESTRVKEKGGFMLNSRVNGVLAVTRSLGDQSMKEWVIGNPYTTETVLSPQDDVLILACDGVWDVCTDQAAVELLGDVTDPHESAQKLLDHSLENFSADNLSIIIVRFNPSSCE